MTRIGLRVIALLFVLTAPFVAGAAQNPFDGSWRAALTIHNMRCTVNLVMSSKQRYSELVQCASVTTWQSGTYVLSREGVLIRNVIDWEPKRRYVLDTGYTGHYEPNAKPPAGSFRVRFTSPDTMVWQDMNFGGILTFRRLSP